MLKLLIDGQTLHTADAARGIGIYMFNVIENLLKIKDIECHLIVSDSSFPRIKGLISDSIILHDSEVLKEAAKHKWLLRPPQSKGELLLRAICQNFRARRQLILQQLYTDELTKIVEAQGIQAYWIPNPLMPNIILPKKISTSTVVMACTIYDLIPLKLNTFAGFWINKGHYLQRLKDCSDNYDIFFHISESTKQDYIECMGTSEKAHIICKAAVADSFFSDPRLTKSSEKKYALTVSGNDVRKNLEMAIIGFKKLVDSHPEPPLQLYVVGQVSVERIKSLQKTIITYNLKDKVVFLGYVDELRLKQLYNNALIFIFPSYYEGFGLPLLEALAAGLPIACSNTSSMPEVCREYAHYFSPESADQIGAALEAAWNEKDSLHMAEARIAYARKFSWKKVAETIADTLNQTSLSKIN